MEETRIVYHVSATNHSLTYEAETPEEVGECVAGMLRLINPLIGLITIQQHVLHPASALKGAT